MTHIEIVHKKPYFNLPHAEVAEVIQFAVNRVAPFRRSIAIEVRRATDDGNWKSGMAYYGSRRWINRAACQYGIRLWPVEPGAEELGQPQVCWHSTEAVRAKWKKQNAAADALAAGKKFVGRWPIFIPADWRESLVHLTAHELSHLTQHVDWLRTGKRPRQSEVQCENEAVQALDDWRKHVRT